MSDPRAIALRKLHDVLDTLRCGPQHYSVDELNTLKKKVAKARSEIRSTKPAVDPLWRSVTAKSLVLISGDPLTDERPYTVNAATISKLCHQLQSDIERAEREGTP